MEAKILAIVIFALFTQAIFADVPHFDFAGITVETTLAEARKRYPESYEANSYIYVRENESHNHIYGVSISSVRTLIHFEKTLENGDRSYPLCRTQFDLIYASYKGPHTVQEFNEELSIVHRRVWKNGKERMVLSCFEMNGSRFAESVELYVVEAGAT